MTDLNEPHNEDAPQQAPVWPHTADVDIADPSVQAAVAALDGLGTLPAAEHNPVYSDVHDALLEALNEDAPSGNGGT
ncbi:MAG: hypothetical protein JWQ75_3440 [Pseudarthrobacter sp.]|nr:hypothetical protein [Pseudarthrobacter sp.]